jgi:secreted trypsin-like serine protease
MECNVLVLEGGDSGGPLMVAAPVQNVPRVFQIGVVSFGPVQCGAGGYMYISMNKDSL